MARDRPTWSGAATDADEDMTFALLMADKQWVTSATLGRQYLDIPGDDVRPLEQRDSTTTSTCGSWPGADSSTTNLSYSPPPITSCLPRSTPPPPAIGLELFDAMYTLLNTSLNFYQWKYRQWPGSRLVRRQRQAERGRIWAHRGSFANQLPVRLVPHRHSALVLIWCWNGEQRAQAYVAKGPARFFNGITVAEDGRWL